MQPTRTAILCLLACCLLGHFVSRCSAGDSRLADAVEAGDLAQATALLAQGVAVDAAQADGMTALLWAVWRDDVALARRLLTAQADANLANRYGITPLSVACLNGRASLVQALLSAGADANHQLASGETPLMLAARTGKPAVVRLLIEAGAEVNATDGRQQTAIMWAAAEGHAAVVRSLIAAGAEFEKPLKSGFNPLLFAVREGRTEAVEALLQAGADINQAMQPARTGGKHPRKGMSPLLLAVENGHFELALRLVEAGADPCDERSGFTALHTVTWVRKPNLGDSADGDPAPEGSGSVTSLQFVRRIVTLGADVNQRLQRGASGRGKLNLKGATPFLLAARTNDVPLMRLLLELGADPHLHNADDCSPLMAAAGIGTLAPGEEAGTEEEALQSVELLLSLGANINHVDANGETAMHGAAYKSLPQVVKWLAAHGANSDVWYRQNKYGWTPWLIAEGHRPGNFKPSAETMAALRRVMLAAGIDPPPPTSREQRLGYEQP